MWSSITSTSIGLIHTDPTNTKKYQHSKFSLIQWIQAWIRRNIKVLPEAVDPLLTVVKLNRWALCQIKCSNWLYKLKIQDFSFVRPIINLFTEGDCTKHTYHFVLKIFQFISMQREPSLLPVLRRKQTKRDTISQHSWHLTQTLVWL